MECETKQVPAANHDLKHKLETAATIQSGCIVPDLCQLIGIRQQLARMILQNGSIGSIAIESEFNYINNKIKELLGL